MKEAKCTYGQNHQLILFYGKHTEWGVNYNSDVRYDKMNFQQGKSPIASNAKMILLCLHTDAFGSFFQMFKLILTQHLQNLLKSF